MLRRWYVERPRKVGLRWIWGPKGEYAFCESIAAGPLARWHIRRLSKVGPKYSGGIDTNGLCGWPKSTNDGGGGWDVRVELVEHHLARCCQRCAEAYRQELSASAADLRAAGWTVTPPGGNNG